MGVGKVAIVDSAGEVCGSVKSVWWNDTVKGAVEMKDVARKEAVIHMCGFRGDLFEKSEVEVEVSEKDQK